MPKYKCQKCGRVFFGWAGGKICKICGGRLKPVNESAKKRTS